MALQQPNVTSGDLIARSRIYLRKFNHQICELQSREVPRHLFDGCVQGASFVARGLSGLSTVVGIEVPYTIMHTPIYHRIISYHIVYHRIPSYSIVYHTLQNWRVYSHNQFQWSADPEWSKNGWQPRFDRCELGCLEEPTCVLRYSTISPKHSSIAQLPELCKECHAATEFFFF